MNNKLKIVLTVVTLISFLIGYSVAHSLEWGAQNDYYYTR